MIRHLWSDASVTMMPKSLKSMGGKRGNLRYLTHIQYNSFGYSYLVEHRRSSPIILHHLEIELFAGHQV